LIFVTVGTHNHGFDRLVRTMDELAAELDEPVIVQYGSSAYVPRHAEGFQWASGQRMEQLTQAARVIVTHAAAGSILVALLRQKPLVVVPRLLRFGEHLDDHQRQLAEALDAQGKAIAVDPPSKDALRRAIEQATRQSVMNDGATQLEHAVRRQLGDWAPLGIQSSTPARKKA
jgi:UDP-N-acetylglucosamine transferase subunit ALG13